jgi:hypothetical protein
VEAQSFLDCLGIAAEQARHLDRLFEMALGIRLERLTAILHRQPEADAGEDILQRAVLGGGIERLVDREQRHLGRLRGAREAVEAALVRAGVAHGRAEPDAIGSGGAERGENVREVAAFGWGRADGEWNDVVVTHYPTVIPAQAGIHIL